MVAGERKVVVLSAEFQKDVKSVLEYGVETFGTTQRKPLFLRFRCIFGISIVNI